MTVTVRHHPTHVATLRLVMLVAILMTAAAGPVDIFSQPPYDRPVLPQRRTGNVVAELPDSLILDAPATDVVTTPFYADADTLRLLTPTDTIPVEERRFLFNPDPTRAVWLSALFPGLGQLYNRRYWKLPIVVGGFMALGYATSWNNTMLSDYSRAYADLMDTDPTTRSYMDFFPPTYKEENIDPTWLANIMRTRKNFYRRNRDLCIICMVGVYLVAIIDAYVDAQLAHFDIAPDLSVDIYPTMLQPGGRDRRPALAMQWALNF